MADTAKKITVEVPEGMTPEKLQKLVLELETRRVGQTARGKAQRLALKEFKANHKQEWDDLVKKYSTPTPA